MQGPEPDVVSADALFTLTTNRPDLLGGEPPSDTGLSNLFDELGYDSE